MLWSCFGVSMKNFRFAVVALGSSIAVAGVLLACTSDETIMTSNDAGTDTGTGPDSTTSDAGTDTGIEDSGPDVLIDAGMTFETFREKFGDTYCKSVARCCFGDPNLGADAGVDGGGHYNQALCLQVSRSGGFEGSLLYNEDAGTALILNQQQALDCLAKIEAISCTLGRNEFVAARAACFNAVRGTATIGAACTTGIDCVPGSFCNSTTAKCEALRPEDGGCGDFAGGSPDEACSWRASGDTNRYCDSWDFAAGDFRPQDEWRCRAAQPNGSLCINSTACSEGLCDDRNDVDGNGETDFVCREPITYFPRTPDFCDSLLTP